MLNQLHYQELSIEETKNIKGGFLGLEVVTAFAILSVISVLIYKIFSSRASEINLPGGFKFKLSGN